MTLADPVSPDLKRHLRTLKLGQLLATLPDRLTLARQQKLPHADFLELLLSDEVTRRENGSAARRARAGAEVAATGPDLLTVSGLSSERIVVLLSGNSVPFAEVSAHRASLEEAYMELTRDAVEFRAEGAS